MSGAFVSQKINKIRWLPEEFGQTTHFVTGSWDDLENDSIKVWACGSPAELQSVDMPRQCSEFKVDGDVTEMWFLDKNKLAVTTSDGDARILEVNSEQDMNEMTSFPRLHNFGLAQCSCTAMSVMDGDIVTVGEDGCINNLSSRRGEVMRTIKDADSCALLCVCFIKHHEVMTGNMRGHMKIWDFRTQNKPVASFLLSGDEQAATCLMQHPTQPHIILAGSESGALAVWDLRMESYPTSLITAHTGPVKEVQFHHENPQKLMTCSAAGEFWEWNMETMTQSVRGPDDKITWLPHSDKSIVRVDALMEKHHKPINSFHCQKSNIVVGSDSEMIFIMTRSKY